MLFVSNTHLSNITYGVQSSGSNAIILKCATSNLMREQRPGVLYELDVHAHVEIVAL